MSAPTAPLLLWAYLVILPLIHFFCAFNNKEIANADVASPLSDLRLVIFMLSDSTINVHRMVRSLQK